MFPQQAWHGVNKHSVATMQVLDGFCKGFNGTVLAYGQTGMCMTSTDACFSTHCLQYDQTCGSICKATVQFHSLELIQN